MSLVADHRPTADESYVVSDRWQAAVLIRDGWSYVQRADGSHEFPPAARAVYERRKRGERASSSELRAGYGTGSRALQALKEAGR